MEPRRGDKLGWIVALVAAVIVVIVALMNGDAVERLFTPHSDGDGLVSPVTGTGAADGGRQEVR